MSKSAMGARSATIGRPSRPHPSQPDAFLSLVADRGPRAPRVDEQARRNAAAVRDLTRALTAIVEQYLTTNPDMGAPIGALSVTGTRGNLVGGVQVDANLAAFLTEKLTVALKLATGELVAVELPWTDAAATATESATVSPSIDEALTALARETGVMPGEPEPTHTRPALAVLAGGAR
ncbi:hypothetical protein ACFV3R_25195 [Streptomyces sp. NPDC059740]|uniref:hypothetical protein n=1 Tax=Streptomyces sp. NPDC059740 TaxID=3346926 RepID=UPI003646AA80